jgi:hypothetical protein
VSSATRSSTKRRVAVKAPGVVMYARQKLFNHKGHKGKFKGKSFLPQRAQRAQESKGVILAYARIHFKPL